MQYCTKRHRLASRVQPSGRPRFRLMRVCRPFPLSRGPMESLRGLSSSPASAYDELVTGQKSIRYHWQGILSVIRALPGGLGERVESARRQLEESGATVNLL